MSRLHVLPGRIEAREGAGHHELI
eukprot:COSAG02_NODE_49322_length_327_cov_1.135965_2_plen_23_part_01